MSGSLSSGMHEVGCSSASFSVRQKLRPLHANENSSLASLSVLSSRSDSSRTKLRSSSCVLESSDNGRLKSRDLHSYSIELMGGIRSTTTSSEVVCVS